MTLDTAKTAFQAMIDAKVVLGGDEFAIESKDVEKHVLADIASTKADIAASTAEQAKRDAFIAAEKAYRAEVEAEASK